MSKSMGDKFGMLDMSTQGLPEKDIDSSSNTVSMYREEDIRAVHADLCTIHEKLHGLTFKGRQIAFHKKLTRTKKSLPRGAGRTNLIEELYGWRSSTDLYEHS